MTNDLLKYFQRCFVRAVISAAGVLLLSSSCRADGPFFVTYITAMEEVGALEVENRTLAGNPSGINGFAGSALEFEYGATSWWTTELYLDGQTTRSEGSSYTGFRVENRFHVLRREHWINPVLYVELEHLDGADKTLLEIVGHDVISDFGVPTQIARLERNTELETKLILDSHFKGWTIAENIIAEKNLNNGGPWEFGYAVGIYRPLVRRAAPKSCNLCSESLTVGVEAYGGVGTSVSFGLQETSHYIGPTLLWSPGHGTDFKISPNFGLNGNSARFLLRVGFSYEIEGVGRTVESFLRRLF